MILVFYRENIILQIRTRVSRWRDHTPVERSEPVISSEEILVGNDESRGGTKVKTPDRSGS